MPNDKRGRKHVFVRPSIICMVTQVKQLCVHLQRKEKTVEEIKHRVIADLSGGKITIPVLEKSG